MLKAAEWPANSAERGYVMESREKPEHWKGRLPGVVLLALALVAALWAFGHFRAESRIGRATARLMRQVEKRAEESPVALGLAANRLGKNLATNAVLEMAEFGPVATGRTEIVQIYVQVRDLLAGLEFIQPRIGVAVVRRGEVQAVVEARYRLTVAGTEPLEGSSRAELTWVKQADGWQIGRALVSGVAGQPLPGGWK